MLRSQSFNSFTFNQDAVIDKEISIVLVPYLLSAML